MRTWLLREGDDVEQSVGVCAKAPFADRICARKPSLGEHVNVSAPVWAGRITQVIAGKLASVNSVDH